MKKLRISSKEVRKLGIHGELSISIIKRVVSRYYKHTRKEEFLAILSDILVDPDKHKKHEHFAEFIKSS